MSRIMYDSIHPLSIPLDAEVVAGYVDGDWPWMAPGNMAWCRARWPNAVFVRIAVFESTNDGDMGDRENGDMDEAGLVRWSTRRRAAGHTAYGYCSESNWGPCKLAFAAAATMEPHWIVAAYPGGGAIIPAGALGHQYADPLTGSGGDYDLSIVADYLPGIDPPPKDLPVKNLVFAQQPGQPAVWVGDGITRRHVPDGATLADMQYAVTQAGGDPTIKPYADLWVLGDPAQDVQAELTAEQTALMTALKALPTGGQVDVPTLVAALANPLAAAVGPLLPPDSTPADLAHELGAALDAAK
jgi:hypothetical protein